MANPRCTLCGENQGVFMDTNLMTGDSQCPCGPCLPMYALTFAAAMTQDMPPEVCESLGDLFDQIAANDRRAKSSAPPARRKSSGSKRAKDADDATDALSGDGTTPDASSPPSTVQDAPRATEAASVDLPEPCGICGSLTATGDDVKLTCDGCGTVLATADEAAPAGPQ